MAALLVDNQPAMLILMMLGVGTALAAVDTDRRPCFGTACRTPVAKTDRLFRDPPVRRLRVRLHVGRIRVRGL